MQHRKKILEERIKAGDVASVRRMVLDMLSGHSGHASTLEFVRLAVGSTPGLFERDDYSMPLLGRDSWTRGYAAEVYAGADRNFSREKVRLYMEIMSDLKRNSGEYADREREAARDEETRVLIATLYTGHDGAGREVVELAEEDVEDLVPEGSREEDREEGCRFGGVSSERRRRIMRVSGYAVMALGAVAAVLALCMGVTLLVGIGIAGIMIGAAVSYFSIGGEDSATVGMNRRGPDVVG